jgi:hypothetical protein
MFFVLQERLKKISILFRIAELFAEVKIGNFPK